MKTFYATVTPSVAPLVLAPLASYPLFLGTAFATHALVGYTLGKVLFDRPFIGAAVGLFPDADFLFRSVS